MGLGNESKEEWLLVMLLILTFCARALDQLRKPLDIERNDSDN